MATEGELNALVGRQLTYQIQGPPKSFSIPGTIRKMQGDLRHLGQWEFVINGGDDALTFHQRDVIVREGTKIINIS